jgi:site-specific DNA recombinase
VITYPNFYSEWASDVLTSLLKNATFKIEKDTQHNLWVPKQRTVKDIELYFDASENNNYVLTCGTVHRTLYKHIVNL